MVISSRNRPCSSCVLRGMVLYIILFDSYLNKSPPQAPLLCATKMAEVMKATKYPAEERIISKSRIINSNICHRASFIVQSYSRVDPAQEIARLRHSISLLESYIFPAHRPPPPQRRQSDASNLVPKKELIDLDVAEKHLAPGILGNQGQGLSQGLYAGPTSAATHLLVSSLFPFSSHYLTVF
jgi:hypothetical protein